MFSKLMAAQIGIGYVNRQSFGTPESLQQRRVSYLAGKLETQFKLWTLWPPKSLPTLGLSNSLIIEPPRRCLLYQLHQEMNSLVLRQVRIFPSPACNPSRAGSFTDSLGLCPNHELLFSSMRTLLPLLTVFFFVCLTHCIFYRRKLGLVMAGMLWLLASKKKA